MLDSNSPVFLHLFWHTTASDYAVVYDNMKHITAQSLTDTKLMGHQTPFIYVN